MTDSILDFSKGGGLIPAIAQDAETGEILMMAYINEDSWRETLRTGHAVYFSRSRNQLWHKGESSGNVQIIRDILVDCDGDTVIFKVEQRGGAACHTGRRSCFYRAWRETDWRVVDEKLLFDPKQVYGKK